MRRRPWRCSTGSRAAPCSRIGPEPARGPAQPDPWDGDAILAFVSEGGAVPVIPPHPCRAGSRTTDWSLYKERAGIEVMVGLIKQFRRVFARFDKLARRHLAFVHLAAACIQLRSNVNRA